MLKQGIKACILGENMKESCRVSGSELSQVKGDMKIEGIVPCTRDLHILRFIPFFLQRHRSIKGYFGLVCPYKNNHMKQLRFQCDKRFWVYIF